MCAIGCKASFCTRTALVKASLLCLRRMIMRLYNALSSGKTPAFRSFSTSFFNFRFIICFASHYNHSLVGLKFLVMDVSYV